MSTSKAKFTAIPSSEVESNFKATLPPALQESIFRTIITYLSYPAPIVLLFSMIFKNTWLTIVSLYLTFVLMGMGLHVLVSKVVFPAQLIAKDKANWVKGTVLDIEVESALSGSAGREVLRGRKQKLLEEFNGHSVNLTTPDDVVLDACYFPGAGSTATGPTVIFYPANMQLYENPSSRQYIRLYTSHGVNVLMFNYRGVSESGGKISCHGTLLDGETVVQYCTQHLGVPENTLILHGRSIGGGVSATIGGIHPEVNLCSERSFSCLTKVVVCLFRAILQVGPNTVVPAGLSFKEGAKLRIKKALPGIASSLMTCMGWDYAAAEGFRANRGHKWVFYHPEDQIIPLEASLYAGVSDGAAVNKWRMEGDPSESHNRPLNEEEMAWHINMVTTAVGPRP
eukprot:TRINITY_DN13527_c0_g1_i2.p1 TRINITY_DN13527_c0_g1~~TRINITY_DN13527_c0_g1_i2.p1  ORF type:complete len:397 (+),score=72.36 TRINITY_DN13527_c0_g1_i2:189-1379(+)